MQQERHSVCVNGLEEATRRDNSVARGMVMKTTYRLMQRPQENLEPGYIELLPHSILPFGHLVVSVPLWIFPNA